MEFGFVVCFLQGFFYLFYGGNWDVLVFVVVQINDWCFQCGCDIDGLLWEQCGFVVYQVVILGGFGFDLWVVGVVELYDVVVLVEVVDIQVFDVVVVFVGLFYVGINVVYDLCIGYFGNDFFLQFGNGGIGYGIVLVYEEVWCDGQVVQFGEVVCDVGDVFMYVEDFGDYDDDWQVGFVFGLGVIGWYVLVVDFDGYFVCGQVQGIGFDYGLCVYWQYGGGKVGVQCGFEEGVVVSVVGQVVLVQQVVEIIVKVVYWVFYFGGIWFCCGGSDGDVGEC